jgi:hypothetical protein
MGISSNDLLRTLGAGIRPAAESTVAGGPKLIEGQSFDQLLKLAKDGEMSSGVPIRIDARTGLKLTPQQSARLAKAADEAEAQGAARAVVLIDGQALTMDVATRTITGKVDTSKANTLADVDAVISVPPDESGAGNPIGVLPKAALSSLSPNLLKALGYTNHESRE